MGVYLGKFCQPVGYLLKFNEVEMHLFHRLLLTSVLNGCVQHLQGSTPIEVQA